MLRRQPRARRLARTRESYRVHFPRVLRSQSRTRLPPRSVRVVGAQEWRLHEPPPQLGRLGWRHGRNGSRAAPLALLGAVASASATAQLPPIAPFAAANAAARVSSRPRLLPPRPSSLCAQRPGLLLERHYFALERLGPEPGVCARRPSRRACGCRRRGSVGSVALVAAVELEARAQKQVEPAAGKGDGKGERRGRRQRRGGRRAREA